MGEGIPREWGVVELKQLVLRFKFFVTGQNKNGIFKEEFDFLIKILQF